MKMKKMLSLLTAAAMSISCVAGMATVASAATERDVVPITSSMTYWFDDATSNGTQGTVKGTLFGNDHFFTSTGNTAAANKGSQTIDGVKHLNSLRLKNAQGTMMFSVGEKSDITIYTQSHGTRGVVVTATNPTIAYTSYEEAVADASGINPIAVEPVNTSVFTFSVDEATPLYLSSYGGDFFIAGVKVAIETTVPTISLDITSKTINTGESFALTTTTQNIGDAVVEWASDDEAVATVTDGTVEAVGAGEAKITASVTVDGTVYSAECTVTVKDTKTISFDISGSEAAGTAPTAIVASTGSSVAIPVNRTLYVEGKTLTNWTDGTNNYAPGSEMVLNDNVTLTPVFTENTVKLGDADATVVFDFQRQNGAPTFALEQKSGILVEQAVINGTAIDVKMDIDTTSGKLANANWTDWAQVNTGTQFTVPTVADSVVTVGTIMGQDGTYTINGVSKTGSDGSETIETAGTCDVVAGNPSGSYWRSITVTYPKVKTPIVNPLPEVTVAERTRSTELLGKAAIGYEGSFTPNETAIKGITWTISGTEGQEEKVSKDLVVSGPSDYVCGLIITINDLSKIASVTAALN